jgi:hypothetical protein
MKIVRFEKYQAKDHTDRYRTFFKEIDVPLITATKPAFGEGDDIPETRLRLVEKDDYAYYVWKDGVELSAKKGYHKTPEEIASIECQVVWKGLVDIFVAGKIEELETSQSPFVKAIARYAERRLVQDHPMIEEIFPK